MSTTTGLCVPHRQAEERIAETDTLCGLRVDEACVPGRQLATRMRPGVDLGGRTDAAESAVSVSSSLVSSTLSGASFLRSFVLRGPRQGVSRSKPPGPPALFCGCEGRRPVATRKSSGGGAAAAPARRGVPAASACCTYSPTADAGGRRGLLLILFRIKPSQREGHFPITCNKPKRENPPENLSRNRHRHRHMVELNHRRHRSGFRILKDPARACGRSCNAD